MTEKNILHLNIICPQCGTTNELVSAEIPDSMMIDCSRCHTHLGAVGEHIQDCENGHGNAERI